MNTLEIKNLTFAYGKKSVIKNINLSVSKGEFVGLIGPNGSGKSTILKNAYRALSGEGEIFLNGKNIRNMSRRETAVNMAVVGQENEIPFNFTVGEIVAMGRAPHKKLFEPDNAQDEKIVAKAMKNMGIYELRDKNYQDISGGEKQRALIARAVAQESDFFILDEPTNHIDISFRLQILSYIKSLDAAVLSVIHDLNTAALFCDRIYALKDGEIILSGTPREVFTKENIKEIFNVDACVQIPENGKPVISFLPQLKETAL